MIPLIDWFLHRCRCTVMGHDMETGWSYHGPSARVQSGYVCSRCGHTQLLLRRWQEVNDE